MKSFSPALLSRIFPAAVLAASGLYLHPASAQELPAPASTQATTQTAVQAPAVQTPAVPAANDDILSIALPPQTKLRIDVDARNKDLLGVVKSFLEGFNGYALQNSAQAGAGKGGNAAIGAAINLLSQADLGEVLREISHLRAVAFEVPVSQWNGDYAKRAASSKSILAFYENKYLTTEGGTRMIKADFDDVQWFGVSFPDGGFGLVFAAPSVGVVVRANGYPNLKSIGPIASTAALFMTGVASAPTVIHNHEAE